MKVVAEVPEGASPLALSTGSATQLSRELDFVDFLHTLLVLSWNVMTSSSVIEGNSGMPFTSRLSL